MTPNDESMRRLTGSPEDWVRLGLSGDDALRIRERLLSGRGTPEAQLLRDALWMRAVMIEQFRRTPRAERAAFARRANRLLRRCVGADHDAVPSVAAHTVRSDDKP
jgi:hypothetical protein